MPYTVSCDPAPLTFTIRPPFNWEYFVTFAWFCFIGYEVFSDPRSKVQSDHIFDLFVCALVSFAVLLSFVRRERIEVYPDRMVWSRTYFGFTRSNAAPITDILAADWSEGEPHGRHGKGPDYVEFYLPTGSVKTCFGFTFAEFDSMREDIRSTYPELVKRWGGPKVRSKTLTLLNLS
jgi:hypothetical protein